MLGVAAAPATPRSGPPPGATCPAPCLTAPPAPPPEPQMAKRTKKVGVTGKYGTRYGASLRKTVRKIEVSQHAKYTCQFCGKVRSECCRGGRWGTTGGAAAHAWARPGGQDAVRRTAVGVWKCRGCRKVMAGGAWTVSTAAATAVRSNIRRLREAQVL